MPATRNATAWRGAEGSTEISVDNLQGGEQYAIEEPVGAVETWTLVVVVTWWVQLLLKYLRVAFPSPPLGQTRSAQ